MTDIIDKYLFFLFIVSSTLAKTSEILCPATCECDMFQNLRRATCVNRNFVSVQAFIPNITQILDMSYNQIRELQDHVFYDESLLSLQLLNLSHNKINHIHINAFYGLEKVKTIDLSHNSLQYILPHWFWDLRSLQELYLSGNAFRALENGPLFESNTLRILDLSCSKISSLEADVFIKVPNLKYLDLSDNDLVQMDVSVISPMKKLELLNVTGNKFNCDDRFANLTQYCIKNNLKYTDPCEKLISNETKMFEKMIMSTPTPKATKNSWIYDDEEDNSHNSSKIMLSCPNVVTRRQNKSFLMEIIELSPELSILFILVCGILIGLIIGCSVQMRGSQEPTSEVWTPRNTSSKSLTPHRLRRSSYFKSTLSLKSRRNIDEEDGQNLVLTAFQYPESSPLCTRKWQI